MIPALHSPRLTLRPHRADDWVAAQAIWTAPALVDMFGGPPATAEQCWHRLLRYRGLWALCGYGYWAITLGERYVGDVGFARFERGLDAPDGPELGWALHPDVWGQGLATEAAGRALRWLDERTAHHQSWCLVADDNHASLRVAEKLGYVEARRCTFHGRPHRTLARRLRPAPRG